MKYLGPKVLESENLILRPTKEVDCYCYEINKEEYLEKNKLRIIRIINNEKYLREYATLCFYVMKFTKYIYWIHFLKL